MIKILIVEDHKNIRKLYSDFLKQQGFETLETVDGLAAIERLHIVKVDLMIVDVMMPRMDGYELAKIVRENDPNLPILMITAKDHLDDKISGFKSGVDDYMTKPIELSEFLMRIQALLRRSKVSLTQMIEIGSFRLDESQFLIKRNTKSFDLPKKEFQLLFKLASYPNRVFTRTQLLDDVWGLDVDTDERTVDVHIKRIREKLDAYNDFKIKTVRGLGYRLEISDEKNTL